MKIAEIFQSVQGEGFLTGQESVFVRTSGCNLRCWFCDTPYTSWAAEGDQLTVEDILDVVDTYDGTHVVITGGEPMMFSELTELTAAMRQRGQHITIETAGTLFQPVECDLMSISPKLSGSAPSATDEPTWHEHHQRRRHAPDVIRRLIQAHDYQVKFVIDQPGDLDEVEAYLQELPEMDRARVMLMPQGTDAAGLAERSRWLESEAQRRGLAFCPRRHIEWFGLVRGR